jgi:hypothetical protein
MGEQHRPHEESEEEKILRKTFEKKTRELKKTFGKENKEKKHEKSLQGFYQYIEDELRGLKDITDPDKKASVLNELLRQTNKVGGEGFLLAIKKAAFKIQTTQDEEKIDKIVRRALPEHPMKGPEGLSNVEKLHYYEAELRSVEVLRDKRIAELRSLRGISSPESRERGFKLMDLISKLNDKIDIISSKLDELRELISAEGAMKEVR